MKVETTVITVKVIDVGNEARRVARDKAPKAGATQKIGDKRNKAIKHKKPLREEY